MRFIRILIGVIGVAMVVCLMALVFLAHVVYRETDAGVYDGLGRTLEVSPWLMRAVLGIDRLWVGWAWFAIDVAVGLVLGGGGYLLASWGFSDPSRRSAPGRSGSSRVPTP